MAPFDVSLVTAERMAARLKTWKAGEDGYFDPDGLRPHRYSDFDGVVPHEKAQREELQARLNKHSDFFIVTAEILSASFVEAVLTRKFELDPTSVCWMVHTLVNLTRADTEAKSPDTAAPLRMYNPAAQKAAYDHFPTYLAEADITPTRRSKFIQAIHNEAVALRTYEFTPQCLEDLTAWRDKMLELAAKYEVVFVDPNDVGAYNEEE